MTTAIANRPTPILPSIVPQNVSELLALADLFFKAGMVPKNCNRPEAVAAVIAFGLELGIKPAAAVCNIMVQNGRGTVWGDIPLALVRASGLLEHIDERHEGTGENRKAICTVKRRGESGFREGRYSVADARKAELFMKGGKSGPWDKDTDHMLKIRARGRLLRDVFTDVLNGLAIGEDIDEASEPTQAKPTATVTVTRTDVAPLTTGDETIAAVNGELMIDEYTLSAIKSYQDAWFKSKGIDQQNDPDAAVAAWVELIKTYGKTSAKQLTQEQGRDLLGILQETTPHPLMAALSGKLESTEPPTATQSVTAS